MTDSSATSAAASAGPRLWWPVLALLGVSVMAVLAWSGGAVGSASAVAAALLVLAGRRPAAEAAVSAKAAPIDGRAGAQVMVSRVVPVWSRQMDSTRATADQGLADLLGSFGQISSVLDSLQNNLESFAPTAAPGAVAAAVDAQSPALLALLAPSERAFRQRDEAVALLASCADTLADLQHQAKQAREIARHTRLVAFNASIEAQRGQQGNNGSQAVANELRDLATRMAASGDAVDKLVLKLGQRVGNARRDGEIHDTSAEELRLELQVQAREALQLLLGSLGTSLHGSAGMRELSSQLREQLEATFVNFQFGDRISQMMGIVAGDMLNFAHWVAANPQATQNDAATWLEALEASYTMEEQRAQHHGNVHVDRGSEVEFF